MIKEDIEEEFRRVRNNIVADHNEGKIKDSELIEKLQMLKESETEAINIITTVRKLSMQRE